MAGSEPKAIKTLAGVTLEAAEIAEDSSGEPYEVGIPLSPMSLVAAVVQLQKTVNELIVRVNALAVATTHESDKVTGEGQSASKLFTAS